MTQASQVITQQWKDGGVVGAELQGQSAVSKKYVDDQLAARDGNIASLSSSVGATQASIDNHIVSPTAHPAQHIPYSGAVIGASNVKQALDKIDQTIDDLILGSGDSGPEVAAARNGYDTLGDRLNAADAQLADKASKVDASATVTFYVSPTGLDTNDGATALTPFQTLQKAFDVIKSSYSVIDGQIVIDLEAGTYEQSARIDSVASRYRIKLIGKVDANGIPTTIFDGTNDSSLPYAFSFSDHMKVYVQDIKVQNFANSPSRSGVVAQAYTNLWTKNVHAVNCGFAGINCDNFVRLYVEGGLVEGNRIGIRGYSNSVITIGYNNPTQSYSDPARTVIRNNTETGVLVYNMTTGHLDFCEIDGNVTGVTIQNSSRLHVWGCLIKNSEKYGVLVGTNSTWVNNLNTFQTNAQDYKRGVYSSELSENEYYTPLMRVEPTVFLDKVTHTGTIAETYLNTINSGMSHVLKANSFNTKGQKLKVIVTGTFAGAGTKTVRVRIDTGLITGFTSVSGSARNFKLEIDIYALGGGVLKVFGTWFEGNSAYNALYTDRTVGLTSNRTITVTGELSDAAGSIVIETFEVREIS